MTYKKTLKKTYRIVRNDKGKYVKVEHKYQKKTHFIGKKREKSEDE